MRRIALFLLLAGAAMPAMAQDDGDGGRRHHQSSDSDGSNDNGGRQRSFGNRSSSDDGAAAQAARAERMQQRMERQRDNDGGGVQTQAVSGREAYRGTAGGSDQAAAMERMRAWRDQQVQQQQQQSAGAPVTVHTQSGNGYMPRQRHYRSVPDTNVATQVFNGQPGVAPAPGAQMPRHRDRDHRWSGDWRRDSRYDWQRWRDRHRSTFRLGFYYDPFGWGYRRYSIGSYIWPNYYQSSYWLNDPWQYRLPPAYGPFRWVRYWDDALLVNIYTGEVVDVIRNFFW